MIDFHTHVFPDPIAEKAAKHISAFYGIPMRSKDARLSTLLQLERDAGIEQVVICSAATTCSQTTRINDFLSETVRAHPGQLYALGAMHQDYPDKGGELLRMRALGLLGVKLHPDIQGVSLDDQRFDALYEALSQTGMLLLAHTGDLRYQNSNPTQILNVLDRFPRLRIICAHLGSWSNWTEGVRYLAGRDNVYVDCSSSLYALCPDDAARIIRAYGVSRVLFGSDFPMWVPEEELHRLAQCKLTDDETDQILTKNARQLLSL